MEATEGDEVVVTFLLESLEASWHVGILDGGMVPWQHAHLSHDKTVPKVGHTQFPIQEEKVPRFRFFADRLSSFYNHPSSMEPNLNDDKQNDIDLKSPVKKPVDVPTKAKAKKLDIQLPYLSTAGTIKTAFEKIRQAATPDRFTPDFVSTKLQMKGGNGRTVAPFLKKIGLVGSDGVPTALYRQFRNPTNGSAAIGEAIKHGYKALMDINEYFYELNDRELQALIIQATGSESGSSSVKQIFYTLKALKEFASFEAIESAEQASVVVAPKRDPHTDQRESPRREDEPSLGMNLSYTINLNLPATSDQSVFNAIFKSLKEHLLSNVD